jgi:hypothetical protein
VLVSLVVALATMAGVSTVKAPDADAALTVPWSGRPGTWNNAPITGRHDPNWYNFPQLFHDTVVYRSPAAGWQKVRIDYVVQHALPGQPWLPHRTAAVEGWINPWQSGIRFPGDLTIYVQRGYLKVAGVITWSDQYGRRLGNSLVSWDARGDYRCADLPGQVCSAGTGWIYLG